MESSRESSIINVPVIMYVDIWEDTEVVWCRDILVLLQALFASSIGLGIMDWLAFSKRWHGGRDMRVF